MSSTRVHGALWLKTFNGLLGRDASRAYSWVAPPLVFHTNTQPLIKVFAVSIERYITLRGFIKTKTGTGSFLPNAYSSTRTSKKEGTKHAAARAPFPPEVHF